MNPLNQDSSKKILCNCIINGCSQLEDVDPFTGKKHKGCYLSPGTVYAHRVKDKEAQKAKDEESKERQVCTKIHKASPKDRYSSDPTNTVLTKISPQPKISRVQADTSHKDLTNLLNNVVTRCETFEFPLTLTFDPTPLSNDLRKTRENIQCPGHYKLKLRSNDPNNEKVLQFDSWLEAALGRVEEIDCRGDPGLIAIQGDIKKLITVNRQRIQTGIEKEWTMQDRPSPQVDGCIYLDAGKGLYIILLIAKLKRPLAEFISRRRSYTQINPVVFIAVLGVVILKTFCLVSREECTFFLSLSKILVETTLIMADPTNQGLSNIISSAIPNGIRAIEKFFNLDPVYDIYVSCMTCRSLFKTGSSKRENSNIVSCPEDFNDEDLDDILQETSGVPDNCPYTAFGVGPPCSTPLFDRLKTVAGKRRPLDTFLMHDFKTWLAAFISRPEIEEVISKPLSDIGNVPEVYRSIWDGPVVRHLPGSDGSPFFRVYGTEIRLLFGLCFDGLNPFGNKSAGKQLSVGAMYLKCFNLPDSMVDRQENMFLVCVIGGPDAPSTSQINHYLHPLVDHFLSFWSSGFYINRTTYHAEGRLVRGAIIPFIMDLHAIRQIIGTGSHNAKFFCTFCSLNIQDIENSDPATWPLPRSGREHHKLAELWRDSPTKMVQDSLFKANSIRWTEFLRLPYFSHTVNTTIDPMHGFQNVFRSHIRDIWQVDHHNLSGDGLFVGKRPISRSKKNPTSAEFVRTLQAFEKDGEESVLNRASKVVLYHLCELNGLRRAGHRTQMRDALKTFFEKNPLRLQDNLTTVRTKDFQLEVYEARKALLKTNLGTTDCRKTLDKYRKNVLKTLCAEVLVDFATSISKSTLIEYLINASTPAIFQNRLSFVDKGLPRDLLSWTRTGKAVLGMDMVEEINKDFVRTVLPSWVSPGPKSFDSSKHGKLSAYEWRTTALIRLAISLPRLWGPRDGRPSEMLNNYMHLLNAVIMASIRVVVPPTSTQRSTASLFREEYGLYLQGRIELYPTGKLQPTEHLLYHIGDQLDRFGPLPKLSTNVFERYNGRLQNQPTNKRLGDLGGTLLRGFCKDANLRSLMSHADRLGLPKDLYDQFEKAFNIIGKSNLFDRPRSPSYNSPNLIDLAKVKKNPLSLDVSRLVRQYMEKKYQNVPLNGWLFEGSAWKLLKCQRNGVTYTVADFNKQFIREDGKFLAHRDSHVLIEDSQISMGKPHSIHKIFALESASKDSLDIFLVVRAYKELTSNHLKYDFWRRFPLSGGRLYYDHLEEEAKVIHMESVLGHFVKTPYESGALKGIDTPCIHVLSLAWHHAFDNRPVSDIVQQEDGN